ncbi:hypothetical protein ACLOJK_011546 [Asimina triloba]
MNRQQCRLWLWARSEILPSGSEKSYTVSPRSAAPPLLPLPLSGKILSWKELELGERRKEKGGREMGMERNPLFIGLLLVLVFGVAVYMRLWAIDFSLSKEDNDLIRSVSLCC